MILRYHGRMVAGPFRLIPYGTVVPYGMDAGFAFHRHSLGQAEVQAVVQGWIDKGSQEKALPCAGTALCMFFYFVNFSPEVDSTVTYSLKNQS